MIEKLDNIGTGNNINTGVGRHESALDDEVNEEYIVIDNKDDVPNKASGGEERSNNRNEDQPQYREKRRGDNIMEKYYFGENAISSSRLHLPIIII